MLIRCDLSNAVNQKLLLAIFLGGLPEGGTPAGHHTPDFYIDESGLELGVRTLGHLVVDYLESAGK